MGASGQDLVDADILELTCSGHAISAEEPAAFASAFELSSLALRHEQMSMLGEELGMLAASHTDWETDGHAVGAEEFVPFARDPIFGDEVWPMAADGRWPTARPLLESAAPIQEHPAGATEEESTWQAMGSSAL